NMLTIPSDVFPGNAVASVYGLASMGSGFGGMMFTLITGWVVEHYSYTPAFFGFGVLPLICASILRVFAGPLRQRESDALGFFALSRMVFRTCASSAAPSVLARLRLSPVMGWL